MTAAETRAVLLSIQSLFYDSYGTQVSSALARKEVKNSVALPMIPRLGSGHSFDGWGKSSVPGYKYCIWLVETFFLKQELQNV
jgi:hypothetical protein